MKRRTMLQATGAASLASSAAAQAAKKRDIIELVTIQMRNSPDNQRQRTSDFLSNVLIPSMKRGGATATGAFTSTVAADGPFILALFSYPSLAAMEATWAKMDADKEFVKSAMDFDSKPGLPFVRLENSLLRGFPSMPSVQVPPPDSKRAPRLFELRTYESNTYSTLQRKIKMFDDGEIGIFRRLGMIPVFFGETVIGPKQPNLTYMLAYDDLAHRQKTWQAFGNDPEWQKMRAMPGYADAEIVSNISNMLLSPLPFSSIR